MMKNPIHRFRERIQLIRELQIKSKTVMNCGLQKEKEGIFCTIYFVRKNLLSIWALSQCIVYWIHFNTLEYTEYTYFYISKNITSHTFCLFLKSSKAFSASLRIAQDYIKA